MLAPIPLLAALPFLLPLLSGAHAQDADSTTTPGVTETSSSSVPTSTAEATTFDIDVGAEGALLFSPETLTASVGDTLNFHFYPLNHSVVQSSFSAPCEPLTSGDDNSSEVIFSGFFPVSDGQSEQMFSVTVNTTDPIWLYCGQASHCQTGMSMVVNPASSGDNTLETYKAAAGGVQAARSPSTGPAGGIVRDNMEEGDDEEEEEEEGDSSSSMTGSMTGSTTASATAASASATATGAAPRLLSPVTGAVAVGVLTLGFGAWSVL